MKKKKGRKKEFECSIGERSTLIIGLTTHEILPTDSCMLCEWRGRGSKEEEKIEKRD
jgi:hypothetical protein